MTLGVNILDGSGSAIGATVTTQGVLVTGPVEFSVAHNQDVDTIDTAFNVVGPEVGKRFVITDILLSTDRQIGNNGAIIILYEATAVDTVTVTTTILEVEMLKSTVRDMTGLNMIASEGVWINIKTDDDNVQSTIMGYFVKA